VFSSDIIIGIAFYGIVIRNRPPALTRLLRPFALNKFSIIMFLISGCGEDRHFNHFATAVSTVLYGPGERNKLYLQLRC